MGMKHEDFCNFAIPSENTKLLEFNQYQKFDKTPFIIYSDLESLIENIDGCKNNPERSFTTKASENKPLGSSMSTILPFKAIKNKHGVCRDCMKMFYGTLREHAIKITNFKKKKMELLTKKQQKLYENVKYFLYL